MDMDRYIGRLLDNRYEILNIIGIGGMAVVYKARCHRLNRLVAIKILKDEYSQDEEFRRRFHAEGQAVAMLSHPNIVSVYDVSTSDEADYIVMELIDGITLKQYMEKKGVLNWKETLHFAIQIGKALEHAHSRGIVHRDIKPHNVMVLKNGSVKVADFGIARVMSKSNTLTKEALGSVHYISTEQAKGGQVDNRSDLYSLGVVMYEMITGRPPFDGESPVSIAIQHINSLPAMPSTLNPNIPGGLEQIIMKAMEKDPARRYPNASTMLVDMDEFRKNPAILFDYYNPAPELDAALKLTEDSAARSAATSAAASAAASTAEPAAHSGTPARRSTSAASRAGTASTQGGTATRSGSRSFERRRKEQIVEEDEGHSGKVAAVAIILCAIAAMVAIGIFIYVFTNSGGSSTTISVPRLVGMSRSELSSVSDLVVNIGSYSYSDEYDEGYVISQTPMYGSQVTRGSTVTVVLSLGPEPQNPVMGSLISLEEQEAVDYLTGTLGIAEENITVKYENSSVIAEGYVTRTEPADGEEIADDATVTLWVSIGEETKTAQMPSVLGMEQAAAVSTLNLNGFTNITVVEVVSNRDAGIVVAQSVDAGEIIDVTTELLLQISSGPQESGDDPDEDLVTKVVTVELPDDIVEDYVLSLWQGTTLLEERTIYLGTVSVQFEMSGEGTVTYELRYNNANPQPLVVNFDE
ncbi:MAG: Stk1 family PASTA domain-containing Ser/Thr kinase [Firmicutes bacterium]|nr:Stk1 family PASTA domain-containing Ser/Thr kinase [Bacillota bacterium]